MLFLVSFGFGTVLFFALFADSPVLLDGGHHREVVRFVKMLRYPLVSCRYPVFSVRGRFRKRNLKHAKECSIQQRRGFACGVCRWKRRSAVLETRQSRRLDSRAVFENGTDKASTGAARILTVAS